MEAPGKTDRMMFARLEPGWSSPVTVLTICHTVRYGSTAYSVGTRMLPARHTRPRSLRTMSTIMRFSARSFTVSASS